MRTATTTAFAVALIALPQAAQGRIREWPHAPSANLIQPGKPGTWDDYLVYHPRVARNLDGSLYRHHRTGRAFIAYTASGHTAGTDNDRIGLVTTTDFRRVHRYSARRPIIDFGDGEYDPSGERWDGTDVAATTFLHTGRRGGMPRFIIFHEGNRRPNDWRGPPAGDEVSIGVATSNDGYHWRKRRAPILTPGRRGAPDSGDLYVFSAMYDPEAKRGERWRGYYTGHVNGGGWAVMLATAPRYDGPWKKRRMAYRPDGASGVTQVWRTRRGTYYMLMDDWEHLNRVSLHASRDGVHWRAVRTVFTPGRRGAWDSQRVYGTERFWDARVKRWRMLYYGNDGYPGDGIAVTSIR